MGHPTWLDKSIMKTTDTKSQYKFSKRRKIMVVILCFIVIYMVSYCTLSFFGKYVPGQSGNLRYSVGLGVTDIARWQPKFIYGGLYCPIGKDNATYFGNILGYFYAPLVLVDQKYFHKTQSLIDPDLD